MFFYELFCITYLIFSEELQVLTETRSSVPNVTVERDQNSIIIAKDKIKYVIKNLFYFI